MGGGQSKSVGKSVGNAAIKQQRKLNMLLLGAPCAGKSTIFRQMKLLSRDGFTSAERQRAKVELRLNLITSLLKLDEISLDLGLNLGSNSAEEAVTRLKLILGDFQYDERNDDNCVHGHADDVMVVADEYVFPKDDVLAVCADPSIQKAYAEVLKPDFQLPVTDTAGRELVLTALPYVLCNVERICDTDFTPSDADLLHLRRHTTSVERISFPCELTIKNKTEVVACTCIDIGGQAQEQLKWEEHSTNIDIIIFVASMADFDRELLDGSNALEQQFALLRNVLDAECFRRLNIIVLLNKRVSAARGDSRGTSGRAGGRAGWRAGRQAERQAGGRAGRRPCWQPGKQAGRRATRQAAWQAAGQPGKRPGTQLGGRSALGSSTRPRERRTRRTTHARRDEQHTDLT